MEKKFLKVRRGLQRNAEGQSMTYNDRQDLLVLTVEKLTTEGNPHVVSARAFCLGDNSGGQIGRPLDEISLPAPWEGFPESLRVRDFGEDHKSDPGFWQIAEVLDEKGLLMVLLEARRWGVVQAILRLLRQEHGWRV